MSHRNTRKYFKTSTIILGGLYMPLAMFIGYSFGAEHFLAGSVAMAGYIVLSLIDGYIFWKLIEGAKNGKRANYKGKIIKN